MNQVGILSSRRVALRTALSPPECAERLAARVKTFMEGASLSRKPLKGRVGSGGFQVVARHGFDNALSPVARGRFLPVEAGTRVEVHLSTSTGWRIWGAVWVAFCVFFGGMQFFRQATSPGPGALARAGEALTGPMVLLAIYVAGVALARWLARDDEKLLLEELSSTLAAEPEPGSPIE